MPEWLIPAGGALAVELGRLAVSDRKAPFVPALGTLVKADHRVRL